MENEKQNKNEKNENLQLTENKSFNKKNKASTTLYVLSVITCIITIVLTIIFGSMVFEHLSTTNSQEKLGTTMGLIAFLVYFGVPALFTSSLSILFSVISIILNKVKFKVLKIVTLVLSILLLIINVIFFIII